MSAFILTYGKTMLASLAGRWQTLQARLDGWLLPAEGPDETGAPDEEEKGGLPTWGIIAIGVAILCIIGVCVAVFITIMGPTLGNLFEYPPTPGA
jgi:hypothetical protein